MDIHAVDLILTGACISLGNQAMDCIYLLCMPSVFNHDVSMGCVYVLCIVILGVLSAYRTMKRIRDEKSLEECRSLLSYALFNPIYFAGMAAALSLRRLQDAVIRPR